MACDDFENYLTRYTDRDIDDPEERVCLGCGFRDCECDEPNDDCLNCGVCEWCIERSIATAEEWGANTEG